MPQDNVSNRTGEVTVRQFEAGDETAFRMLNEQWIDRYFELETKDLSTLADPHSSIIKPGGLILIGTIDGCRVGCCALLRINERELEVAKMAVSPEHQGRGIGRLLLSAAVMEGRRLGANRLYLETNHILKPAIALYESLGFKHIDPTRVVPSPYARADVYMELCLNDPT